MVEPREGGVGEHVGGIDAHHLEELLGVDAPVGIATHEHRVGAHLGRLPEEQCICSAWAVDVQSAGAPCSSYAVDVRSVYTEATLEERGRGKRARLSCGWYTARVCVAPSP